MRSMFTALILLRQDSLRASAMIFLGLLLAHCAHQPPKPPPTPTKPEYLDPLTAEERKDAERLARSDERVRELLGERGRLSYVEFLPIKPADEAATTIPRHAEVVFSRLDADYGVRAVVALESNSVVSADRVNGDNVPLTETDLEEAREIALQSAEVRSAVGTRMEQAKVEGLRILATDEKDPCFHRRCLRLMFKVGNDYLSEPIVIVNLSTNSVILDRRP